MAVVRGRPVRDQALEELRVRQSANQVSGVKMHRSPRLVSSLNQLVVMESGTHSPRHGLMALSAVIVTQSVVGEPKRLWKQPALALSEEPR